MSESAGISSTQLRNAAATEDENDRIEQYDVLTFCTINELFEDEGPMTAPYGSLCDLIENMMWTEGEIGTPTVFSSLLAQQVHEEELQGQAEDDVDDHENSEAHAGETLDEVENLLPWTQPRTITPQILGLIPHYVIAIGDSMQTFSDSVKDIPTLASYLEARTSNFLARIETPEKRQTRLQKWREEWRKDIDDPDFSYDNFLSTSTEIFQEAKERLEAVVSEADGLSAAVFDLNGRSLAANQVFGEGSTAKERQIHRADLINGWLSERYNQLHNQGPEFEGAS